MIYLTFKQKEINLLKMQLYLNPDYRKKWGKRKPGFPGLYIEKKFLLKCSTNYEF